MIKTLDVTDFQSDTRIKRFKRLIFGVNPAAAEFRHVLQTILADIPVTTNIADDILIFAENTKQHGETLTRVLERYKSKGTTLNLEKSVFFKNNLKYYSFMFSKKGMKPDPGKVKEIQETPTPENKKALQSFLGLTNYMKRFTHDYSIQRIIYENYYRRIKITYGQKHMCKLVTTLNILLIVKVVFSI